MKEAIKNRKKRTLKHLTWYMKKPVNRNSQARINTTKTVNLFQDDTWTDSVAFQYVHGCPLRTGKRIVLFVPRSRAVPYEACTRFPEDEASRK